MDFFSPNFAFLDQSTDDLSQIFNQPNTAQQQLEHDLAPLGNMWAVDAGNSTTDLTTKKRSTDGGRGDGNPNGNADSKKRKIIHREVERQRRQEMSILYASLRTMLPLQYLKGKRSISDHMHGAVNYIKHVQSRIEELKKKRGELHECCNNLHEITSKPCSSSKEYYEEVEEAIVRPCLAGVEVVISTRPLKQPLPLSCILEVVAGAGLSVVGCNSTKVNERFVHTILTEVSCWRSIDLYELQQKLKKLKVPLPVS